MIEVLDSTSLEGLSRPEVRQRALHALEDGGVVHLPSWSFEIAPDERPLMDPSRPVRLWWSQPRDSGRPTLLFDQSSGRLRGGIPRGMSRRTLKTMLTRYADWSRELVQTLLPDFVAGLEQEYTTFRPCDRTAKQKLHIDAATARPTQGRCMLRVFSNVNGAGVPRVWHVGGHFQAAAERFVKRLPARVREPIPGRGWALYRLGRCKGPATAYDHTMRRLRDLMTGDKKYQRRVPREIVEFPVGSTWLALTDVALHGAISGQYSLDQTFLIDASLLRDPERSSLRILEKLTHRRLA